MTCASLPRPGTSANNNLGPAAAASSGEIQTKVRVFDLTAPNGSTAVGSMVAFNPKSHAFWWRPVPFIAQPNMLEGYFERCQSYPDLTSLLNFRIRGNEVVVTTSYDYAKTGNRDLTTHSLARSPILACSCLIAAPVILDSTLSKEPASLGTLL